MVGACRGLLHILTRKSTCVSGWPEPYICIVYDLIFGDVPAKNIVYIYTVYICFWPTLHMCCCDALKRGCVCAPAHL